MSSSKIDAFFKAHEEICKLFGYEHDWRVFPIVDNREMEWFIVENEVIMAEKLTSEIIEKEEYYSSEIYTYRHLSKWIYETNDYTMILVDTGSDLNIWLSVLDNMKKKQWKDKGVSL